MKKREIRRPKRITPSTANRMNAMSDEIKDMAERSHRLGWTEEAESLFYVAGLLKGTSERLLSDRIKGRRHIVPDQE